MANLLRGLSARTSAIALAVAAGSASVVHADPLPQPRYAAGEIVVFPESLEVGRQLRSRLVQEQFTILGFAPISGMMIVAVEPGLEDAVIQWFREEEGVRIAERSHAGSLGSCGGPGTPPTSDPDFSMQWHLHNTEQEIYEYGQSSSIVGDCGVDIDAIRGWQRTMGSPDVWLAVFDTGIELDNPEFEGRLAPEETWISLSCPELPAPPFAPSMCCCNGGDCNFGDPFDLHGHGTWVAATAMANHNDLGVLGVDPSCTLLPVRISAGDTGMAARTIIALEMIDNANGANETYESVKVINMSNQPMTATTDDGQSIAFRDALESLREEGVIIVAISGNNENLQANEADYFLPSASPDVISVGATDNKDRRLASSTAPTVVNSGRGDALDFVAPGFAILTAGCETQVLTSCDRHCTLAGQFDPPLSGTSGAAPQVAGIVTLLFARANQLSIALDFDDVYAILSAGAVKLGTSATTHDPDYGWGRVSLYESLRGLERLHYECDADVTHTDDPGDYGYGVPDGKVDADDQTAFYALWSANSLIADLTTTGYISPGSGGLHGEPDGNVDGDDLLYFIAFYSNCGSLPCPACPP